MQELKSLKYLEEVMHRERVNSPVSGVRLHEAQGFKVGMTCMVGIDGRELGFDVDVPYQICDVNTDGCDGIFVWIYNPTTDDAWPFYTDELTPINN